MALRDVTMVRGLSSILSGLPVGNRLLVESWEVANVMLSAGRVARGRYRAHTVSCLQSFLGPQYGDIKDRSFTTRMPRLCAR